MTCWAAQDSEHDMAEIRVDLTLGKPDTGAWCDHCFLPSALRFPMYMTLAGSTRGEPASFLYFCDACGHDWRAAE